MNGKVAAIQSRLLQISFECDHCRFGMSGLLLDGVNGIIALIFPLEREREKSA